MVFMTFGRELAGFIEQARECMQVLRVAQLATFSPAQQDLQSSAECELRAHVGLEVLGDWSIANASNFEWELGDLMQIFAVALSFESVSLAHTLESTLNVIFQLATGIKRPKVTVELFLEVLLFRAVALVVLADALGKHLPVNEHEFLGEERQVALDECVTGCSRVFFNG